MAFDTLDARLKAIAEKTLAHFKLKYGASGLKIEKAIAPDIGWTPSFHMTPARFRIVAVEVNDLLFPEVLKGAAYDIEHFDGSPISVFQACSLNVYQSDPKQTRINILRNYGFGIVTADDDGKITVQHPCVPLAQNISEKELDSKLAGLTPKLKVSFHEAHSTYLTNAGQGLQQAGQIVEAIITSIAGQAEKKGVLSPAEVKGGLAEVIDALYSKNPFRNHRAALGDARNFVKEFRNLASHAPRSAKQASDRIKHCRIGFLSAVNVAAKLRTAAQELNYTIRVHIT